MAYKTPHGKITSTTTVKTPLKFKGKHIKRTFPSFYFLGWVSLSKHVFLLLKDAITKLFWSKITLRDCEVEKSTLTYLTKFQTR